MTQEAIAILTALVFLNTKHLVADFFLQFPYQYKNKGTYGHPGGLLHAFIHLVCSLPVFLIIQSSGIYVGALIVIAEFIAHYHIDWLKVYVNKTFNLHARTEGFFYAIGVDQFAHQLTYLAMIAAILSF